MIAAPNRIQIWSSQLAANDFPPVCAMTGRTAQTWRKFNFQTPPGWAYALLFLIVLGGLGLIIFAIVVYLISEKASGHLPLTFKARNRLRIVIWTVLLLLPVGFALFIAGAALGSGTDSATSGIGALMSWLGALAVVAFFVAALTRGMWGPRGKVSPAQPGYTDKLVELRNVHPNFVAAVQQMHAARLAQSTSST